MLAKPEHRNVRTPKTYPLVQETISPSVHANQTDFFHERKNIVATGYINPLMVIGTHHT